MIIKYEEVANLYDPGLNPILSLNLCLGIVVPLYFSFGILVQRVIGRGRKDVVPSHQVGMRYGMESLFQEMVGHCISHGRKN